LPDLALNLFLSLGAHVELLNDEIFINPLAGYVEDKLASWKTVYARRNDLLLGFSHVGIFAVANATRALVTKGNGRVSGSCYSG
jgi:hypothetical protein